MNSKGWVVKPTHLDDVKITGIAKMSDGEKKAARLIATLVLADGWVEKWDLRYVRLVKTEKHHYVEATIFSLAFDCTMGHGYCFLDEDGEPTRVRISGPGRTVSKEF